MTESYRTKTRSTKAELLAEVARLQEIISTPELGIRKLLVADGTIQGDFTAPPAVILLMGEAMLGMLGDAPNYREASIAAGALDGQKYVLRVERYFGKTPHQKRVEAEAELERVRGVAKEGLREIAGRQIEELGNLPHAILAALETP